MAALIGSLRASLSLDSVNFERGMKRAQRTAETSSKAITKPLGGMKTDLLKGFAAAFTSWCLHQRQEGVARPRRKPW